MGALDFLSDYITISTPRKKRKAMQVYIIIHPITLSISVSVMLVSLFASLSMSNLNNCSFLLFLFLFFLLCVRVLQTVEIKVKMDCDGCERRVKNAVSNMKGSYLSLPYFFHNKATSSQLTLRINKFVICVTGSRPSLDIEFVTIFRFLFFFG